MDTDVLKNSNRRDILLMAQDYPVLLHDLEDPPPVLSVEGELSFASRPVLGIVGTRDSSLLAESWMREHLPELAKKNLILSGGARGIDELAHQIAIHEKQPTAVILPSALDRPYPLDWNSRKAAVFKYGGCLISEYEPGTSIRRWHFDKRNRLIAALSDVVLIVEARRRSGTSITARHAKNLERPIAALPWFASDPRGEFCNDLLKHNEAWLVRSAADLEAILDVQFATRDLRSHLLLSERHAERHGIADEKPYKIT